MNPLHTINHIYRKLYCLFLCSPFLIPSTRGLFPVTQWTGSWLISADQLVFYGDQMICADEWAMSVDCVLFSENVGYDKLTYFGLSGACIHHQRGRACKNKIHVIQQIKVNLI